MLLCLQCIEPSSGLHQTPHAHLCRRHSGVLCPRTPRASAAPGTHDEINDDQADKAWYDCLACAANADAGALATS